MNEHTTPCNQVDNIKHLTDGFNELKGDVKSINRILKGNGDGKGMQTDLALVRQSVNKIEESLSTKAEVEFELELDRRVRIEIDKRKATDDEKGFRIKQIKVSTVMAAIAFIGLIATVILGFKKQNERFTNFREEVKNAGVPIQNERGMIEGVWPWDYMDSTQIN